MRTLSHRAGRLVPLGLLLVALAVIAGCDGGPSNTGGNGGGTSTTPELQAMENEAFAAVNAARAGNSLPALTLAADVLDVARAHSQDMAARHFFSHVNPDGESPGDRLTQAGITFTAAAENLAMNLNVADPVQIAVDGWLASSGHYANIMNATVTESGLGIAQAQDGTYYFTQVFVKRR